MGDEILIEWGEEGSGSVQASFSLSTFFYLHLRHVWIYDDDLHVNGYVISNLSQVVICTLYTTNRDVINVSDFSP